MLSSLAAGGAAADDCVPQSLHDKVRGYTTEQAENSPHVQRWRQVLAAFGEANGHSPYPLDDAKYNCGVRNWKRWCPVVDALECLAGGTPQDALPTATIESATTLEGNSIAFVVRLDRPNPTQQRIGFSWSTAGVTATPEVDYRDASSTASFSPGESLVEIIVLTIGDDIAEGSETFRLIASNPDGVQLANTEAIGTITEPSPPSDLPQVSIFANEGSIEEGGVASFTLDASPRPATNLRVTVEIRQTGSFVAPGQIGRRTVTVDSRGRGDFTVATTDNSRNEAAGTIQATVISGQGYQATGTARYRSVSTDVTDNDLPVISISGGARVSEGGTARFTLSASPRPAAPIDVNVTVSETGAFAAEGQLGARTVAIDTSGRGTLEVRTDSDSTDEDDGSIGASLDSGQGYSIGSPRAASVDVTDGGAPTPRIRISARSSAIVEGDTATFDLTASPRPASPLDVQVDITDSGRFASPGETGTRTVTIDTNGRATIAVATDNDLDAESDGILTAQVLSDTGFLVVAPGSVSVTVRDESVNVRISSDGNIVEGGTATFTLTASPLPPEALVVEVGISETGDFLPGGGYTETVAIGTDGRGTLSVDTIHDGKAESDGAITASIMSGTSYAIGSPGQATAGVTDSTPTVTIAAGPAIIEGDTAIFTLAASPAPRYNQSVSVAVAEEVPGRFTISGEAGTRLATLYTDGTGILEVRTEDDQTDEGAVDLTATIVADGGDFYRIGSPASASLRINDNDSDAGDLTVSVADAEVHEGEWNGRYRSTLLRFAVTLNKASNARVQVHFATRAHDGAETSPATGGADFRDDVSLWLTFDPGETEKVLEIPVFDDEEYEELPEAFELVISRVYGAEIGDGVAIGKILPDPADAPRGTPVVTITGGDPVWEGQAATFTLTADPAPRQDLVVEVTVFDDSIGYPASDHLAVSEEGVREIVIPGVTNHRVFEHYGDSVAYFSVQTTDDSTEEASGKVRVVVETPADGRYDTSGTPYQAEVDILDNDAPPLAETPAFSISDATANEADGYLVFDVTLDPPVPANRGPMTVFFQILSWGGYPGGATRDVDFEDKYGTLTFYEGEYEQQIEIRIIDDAHDEGSEIFNVLLSSATGGASIEDSVGLGTIVNSDPMPQAWLGRFGRAVADHAIEGITERIEAGHDAERAQGFRGTIAGSSMGGSTAPIARVGGGCDSLGFRAQGAGAYPGAGDCLATATELVGNPVGSASVGGLAGAMHPGRASDMALARLVMGSRFTYTGAEDANRGVVGVWGRGARTMFGGSEGTVQLDGEVTTALLGADYARNDWLVGVALAQTYANGGYGAAGLAPDGAIETSLSAAIPYASWQASERLNLWGATGAGAGEVRLGADTGHVLRADIDWTMRAAGLRSDLVVGANGGELALVSDALWARTASDRTSGLVATDAAVSRLRLGVEASRPFALPGSSSLKPKLEVGMRHDGGDAETGLGMEVGGGIAWADPRLGLTLNLEGRALVSHDDGTMRDRGFSASLSYDPQPASAHGLSLALRQDLGAASRGGLDALFTNDPFRSGHQGSGAYGTDRWTTELGYGLPVFGGRFVGTPHIGYGVSYGAREVGVGWRFSPAVEAGLPGFSLRVQASRREGVLEPADHRVGIEMRARW